VKIYPAHFFAVMSSVLKYLISASVFLLFAGSASINAAPTGFVEGHLKIVSPKEVELADGSPPAHVATVNYAEYPLIILSRYEKKEIAKPLRKKRNRAGDSGRKWKLPDCIATWRLHSGCARSAP